MHTTRKICSLIASASLLPAISYAAADTATASATAEADNSFNPLLISLMVLSIVLLFAIAVLAGVLKSVAFAYRNKMRQQNSGTIVKTILMLLALSLPALTVYSAETDTVKEVVAGTASASIGGLSSTQFYFLIGIVVLELVITVTLVFLIRTIVHLFVTNPEGAIPEEAKTKLKMSPMRLWDRLNKSVEIENEDGITLDHDYDGIKELDNNLPPWWKYGFYLTIVVAVAYIWYYHGGGAGPSSYDEYVAEVKAGEEAKAAYLAKSSNNVDENTIEMGDAASIAAGATIFQNTCAACHAKDGGGNVGPNLTDNYWLHGGTIKDVFKSIKYGWADKGMKSWKDDFSPRQLADLASYVKSLKGTSPAAPKEKQGELFMEDNPVHKEETAAAQ